MVDERTRHQHLHARPTARTSPRCGTGSGPAVREAARRQRRLELAQALGARRARRTSVVAAHDSRSGTATTRPIGEFAARGRRDRRGRPPRRARRRRVRRRRSSSTTTWWRSSQTSSPLAPLHQPRALAAIAAARRALPRRDVTSRASTPRSTRRSRRPRTSYALPAAWRARWPLRRFGFHGLSHAYAARRAAELAGRVRSTELQVVSCHLGAGASLCAVRGGRSVDTTMGFTPLEGLVMATRAGTSTPDSSCGSSQSGGLTADEVRTGSSTRSGLAGLAGTPDMRAVLERPRARRRATRRSPSTSTPTGCAASSARCGPRSTGFDVCVFTGGVGEHAPEVRAACGLDARSRRERRDDRPTARSARAGAPVRIVRRHRPRRPRDRAPGSRVS